MSSTQLMVRLCFKGEVVSFLFRPVVLNLGDFVPQGIFGNVWTFIVVPNLKFGTLLWV